MTTRNRRTTPHGPKPDVAGVCAECGSAFSYRRRGRDQMTCSEDCRTVRSNRQAAVRFQSWLDRQVAQALAQAR